MKIFKIIIRILWLLVTVVWLIIGGSALFIDGQEFSVISEQYVTFAIACAVLSAPLLFTTMKKISGNESRINWIGALMIIIIALMIAPIVYLVSIFFNIKKIMDLSRDIKSENASSAACSSYERESNDSYQRRRYLESTTYALEKILDENNHDNVFISDGQIDMEFRQVGIVYYSNELYCLLSPVIEANPDGSMVIAYAINESEEIGGMTMIPITDENLTITLIEILKDSEE